MWVIFCNSDDVPAYWVYQGLKKRGLKPIELITVELLIHSLNWEYCLTNDSDTVKISLGDGREINNKKIEGVINRISDLPFSQSDRVDLKDQEYAYYKNYAFFMSWLNSLPNPVINRPEPNGLSGRYRCNSEWVALAIESGLPVHSYEELSWNRDLEQQILNFRNYQPDDIKEIIVLGDKIFGTLPNKSLIDASINFGRLSNLILLGLKFVQSSNEEWLFAGATILPDLRIGGEELLNELMLILK